MARRLLTAIALLLSSALLPAEQQRSVDDFFSDFTAEWVRGNPDQATGTRYFAGEEQRRLERQLTPVTAAYQRTRIALARKGLMELRMFDRAAMSTPQRVSADVMQWQLEAIAQSEPYLDYFFPLEQFGGVNVGLVNALTVSHPLITGSDGDNYIARLGLVGPRMEDAIEEARRIAARGLIPPRFILRATISQMQRFTASPPARNPFVTAFASRMEASGAISRAKREALLARAETIVASQVYPSWQKAVALLESLAPRATDEAGLWRFGEGPDVYAYSLRRYTTTNLTADEIHEIGLAQVERIEQEMDALLRQLGRSDGSVKDRIEKLKQDLSYPDTADGRTRMMVDVEAILRDAEKRAAALFDVRPNAPVVAQSFPKFQEASAAASYTAPAPDGSRPGTFRIPLRPSQMTKFALRSLVYHETVPGHHFQVALDVENDALPRFRRIRAFGSIPALSEGWGLYAERLAAESGWYDGDPEGRLGQLDSELFRARRLVVDTGLHARHWTRQQAIDYGIEASEVERYVVYPGQACAYMIGELKILELRDRARDALGQRFSARDFHTAVLRTGTVPLEVLGRQIDAYIQQAIGSLGDWGTGE